MAKKEKSNAGRPPVVTDDVLRQLDLAFASGATDKEACILADISETALYDYQKENPEYTERKKLLKDLPGYRARMVVIEAIEKGDKAMSQWYLERKFKTEFSTRVENTGADGKDLLPPEGVKVTFVKAK